MSDGWDRAEGQRWDPVGDRTGQADEDDGRDAVTQATLDLMAAGWHIEAGDRSGVWMRKEGVPGDIKIREGIGG